MFLFLLWACQSEPTPPPQQEEPAKQIETPQPEIPAITAEDLGPLRRFVLNDGSIISGYLIRTNPEGLVVKSDTLGIITIASSKLQSMDLASSPTAPTAPLNQESSRDGVPTLRNVTPSRDEYTYSQNDTIEFSNITKKQAISQFRDQMLQDPDILNSLYQLQSDPDFMSLAQDPEILRLIQTGDLEALSKHPKIKRLERKPALKSIFKSLE